MTAAGLPASVTAGPLALPRDGDALLTWAALVLLWTAVNYLHRLDPVGAADHRWMLGRGGRRTWLRGVTLRALGGGALAYLLVDGPADVMIGGLFVLLALALPIVRDAWARRPGRAAYRELRAEWELTANAAFLLPSAVLAESWNVRLSFGSAGHDAGRLAVVLVGMAAVIFLLRGGTHVVRGVLEKSDTLPPRTETGVDGEVRHGLTIGNLERLLVFALAVAGAYGALALVVAAKGLVRALEWRNREMLEYFLVGTLASVTLAVFTGIGVGWLASTWW